MYSKILLSLAFVTHFCYGVAKPNIVLVLTDDQDSVMGGTIPMRNTRKNIAKLGISFTNSFAAVPVCCPSRSSILTGLYPHNHRTTNNSISGGCSSTNWQNTFENLSFGSILSRDAGYKTFYAGKYLNEYGKAAVGGAKHVPRGWTEWRGLLGNSRYYNFTLSHNGVAKHYFDNEYLTDIISEEAVRFIKNMTSVSSPFLMVLATPAPHAPFTPAPRHRGFFNDTRIPRTPIFNKLTDKERHWFIRQFARPLSDDQIKILDEIYQQRWETLLSVDEMVQAVIDALDEHDFLNNTYLIFTSDHGYHLGQFGLPFDKRTPYEFDIRVPLMIRGPGITPDTVSPQPIIGIDLAPTILTMAGLEPPPFMDGIPIPLNSQNNRSENLEPSISTNEVSLDNEYDRQMLIEYHGEGDKDRNTSCVASEDEDLFMCLPEFDCKCQDARNNTYSCIRHLHPAINFIYCSFNDSQLFEEAYDLDDDKYQEQNIVRSLLPSIHYEYKNHLEILSACNGRDCNQFND